MEKKISWQHIDAAATSVLNLTCPHHVVVFAYWGLIHCLPFLPRFVQEIWTIETDWN